MRKPDNYDDVDAIEGGRKGPDAGPHIFKILSAYEKNSSNGNPMLVLEMDIAEGEYSDYYSRLSDRLNKPFYQQHKRTMVESGTAYLKGDILAIEKSNPGFKFNFDESTLIGKLVGGNMRREEYFSKEKMQVLEGFPKVAWLFPISEIHKQPIPQVKKMTEEEIENARQSAMF